MILTDTPLDAFDKISMDIVGPLHFTNIRNSYILTIQDPFYSPITDRFGNVP